MATEDLADERDDSPADFASPAPPPVTLTEPDPKDDDDDEGDGQPRGKDGKWATQKAGRDRGRGRMRDQVAELEAKATTLQAKLDAFTQQSSQERQAYLTMLAQQRAPQQQQQSQDSPAAARLSQLEQAIDTERELLARDPKRPIKTYNDLMNQFIDARADARVEAQLAKQKPREAERQGGNPQYEYRAVQMESEFPWLMTNREAGNAAGAYRRYLLATGKPDTLETDRLACAHIAAQYKLGGSPGVSERGRRALAAPPPGSARPASNGQRQVQVDPRMLAGTGLSRDRLSKALFNDEE